MMQSPDNITTIQRGASRKAGKVNDLFAVRSSEMVEDKECWRKMLGNAVVLKFEGYVKMMGRSEEILPAFEVAIAIAIDNSDYYNGF